METDLRTRIWGRVSVSFFSRLCRNCLGVNPPSRFGEFKFDDSKVVEFSEKPAFMEKWINGGYFFFRREFLSYLSDDSGCVLEQEPLTRLAQDHKLQMFQHQGFWQCMDTQRDCDHLNEFWKSGKAPWKKTFRSPLRHPCQDLRNCVYNYQSESSGVVGGKIVCALL